MPPALPPTAVATDRLGKADQRSHATDLGLDVVKRILELGVDPTNPRVLGHVRDTALTIVGLQVKVDQERLRSSRVGEGGSLEDFYRDSVLMARRDRRAVLVPAPSEIDKGDCRALPEGWASAGSGSPINS